MIRRMRIGKAPLLSAVLSLMLAALLAASLSAPARRWEPAPEPASAAIAPPAAPPAAALPSLTRIDTAETLARPLFVPSRRPPSPAPAAGPAAAAPGALANMTLIGTIVGPGARVAIIRTPSASVAQRLTPGQSINGWEIVEIAQDRIVMRAGGGDQELVVPSPSQMNGPSHPAARQPSPAPPR